MNSIVLILLINMIICIQTALLFQKIGQLPSNQTTSKIIQRVPIIQQKYITISFTIEDARNFTYTLATASFEKQQQQITYHAIQKALDNPSGYNGSADLPAFIQGNIQYISLQKKLEDNEDLYISIINFDPPALKRDLTYKIVVQSTSSPFKKKCLTDLTVKTNRQSKQCQCIPGYFGEYCQKRLRDIAESQIIGLDIKQDQIFYYVLPKLNEQIILSIKVIGEQIDLYLLKSGEGKPASYFAFSYGTAGKISLPKPNSQNKGMVTVNTWLSQPLYLTIAKYTPQKTRIQMEFKTYNIFSKFIMLLLMLFVMSGCFSISLLFLLKIRYFNRMRRLRMLRRNRRARNILFVDQDDLDLGISTQLKTKHFPSFKIGQIFHPDEQFIQNHIQCPICLCQYQPKDEANLLYCGHMFHQQCINQWFETHKNCPSCRFVFTSANLKKYKQKIQQITGGQQVTTTRHIQALLCVLPNSNSIRNSESEIV